MQHGRWNGGAVAGSLRRVRRGEREIVLSWGAGIHPLTWRDAPPGTPVSHVEPADDWRCPVCDRSIPRRPGPGRQRVYCTNACRQYAYRWRRDRLGVDADPRPLQRASTRERHHAVRRSDDPVGRPSRGRRHVTACGTFAALAADDPAAHGHVRLLPVEGNTGPTGSSPRRACARCVELARVDTLDGPAVDDAARAARSEHHVARAVAQRRRSGRRPAP